MSLNNFLIEVENIKKYPELFEEDVQEQKDINVKSPDELRTKLVSIIKKIPFLNKYSEALDKAMRSFQSKAESIVKDAESSSTANSKMEAFVKDLEDSDDQIMESYVVGKKAYLIHDEKGFLSFEMKDAIYFKEDYQERDLITGHILFVEGGSYLFCDEGEVYLFNEGAWDTIKSGAKSLRNVYFGDPDAKGTVKGGKVKVGQSQASAIKKGDKPIPVISPSFIVKDGKTNVEKHGVITVDTSDSAAAKNISDILNVYVMKKSALNPKEKETVTPIQPSKINSGGKQFYFFQYAAGPKGEDRKVATQVQKKLFDIDLFKPVKSEIKTRLERKEKIETSGGKESLVMKILRNQIDSVKSETRRDELLRAVAGKGVRSIIGMATPALIGLTSGLGITLPVIGTATAAILTIFGSCLVTHLINKYILQLDIPFERVVLITLTVAAASYGMGKIIGKIKDWWNKDAKTIASDVKSIGIKSDINDTRELEGVFQNTNDFKNIKNINNLAEKFLKTKATESDYQNWIKAFKRDGKDISALESAFKLSKIISKTAKENKLDPEKLLHLSILNRNPLNNDKMIEELIKDYNITDKYDKLYSSPGGWAEKRPEDNLWSQIADRIKNLDKENIGLLQYGKNFTDALKSSGMEKEVEESIKKSIIKNSTDTYRAADSIYEYFNSIGVSIHTHDIQDWLSKSWEINRITNPEKTAKFILNILKKRNDRLDYHVWSVSTGG